MIVYLRPVLAILAMAVLSIGTRVAYGFFTWRAILMALLALSLAVAACLWPNRPVRFGRDAARDLTLLVLVAVALVLGAAALYSPEMAHFEAVDLLPQVPYSILRLLCFTLVMAIAALAETVLPVERSPRRLFVPLLVLALAGGFTLRAAILRASPEPVIDVYNLLRDYADYMIQGVNPYANDIVSPYETPRARLYALPDKPEARPAGYPPLPFLLSVPPRLLGGDVRWSNVAGDMAAALALVFVARRRGWPLAGVLAAAVYLNFPRVPFVFEHAWYEPMIAGLLGLGFLFAEMTGWKRWAGYALLGLGLSAKQFGAPLLPALAWPHRQNWRPLLVGLALAVLVMLPWFLWSPSDFMDIVFWKHFQRPPQHYRALTVSAAWFKHTGEAPPRLLLWAVAGGLIVLVSGRAPREGPATSIALGTALLTFCLFHTQGFLNYFYLVEYLLLLGAMGSLADRKLCPPKT